MKIAKVSYNSDYSFSERLQTNSRTSYEPEQQPSRFKKVLKKAAVLGGAAAVGYGIKSFPNKKRILSDISKTGTRTASNFKTGVGGFKSAVLDKRK